MKKTIFYSIFALTALLLFGQSVPLEARSRHHHSTRVQVGIGADFNARETYVARRYVRPVVQPVYFVPAYPGPGYAYSAPVYSAPVYSAPVYSAPAYVEEVYVAPRVCHPFTFGGLSLSWNFFK